MDKACTRCIVYFGGKYVNELYYVATACYYAMCDKLNKLYSVLL